MPPKKGGSTATNNATNNASFTAGKSSEPRGSCCVCCKPIKCKDETFTIKNSCFALLYFDAYYKSL